MPTVTQNLWYSSFIKAQKLSFDGQYPNPNNMDLTVSSAEMKQCIDTDHKEKKATRIAKASTRATRERTLN